jgi:predicted DNA-binding transcriptional regulator AlpA
MKDFPQPCRIGGATRWSGPALRAFELAQGLDLPELGGLATVREVANRYRVSVATIWRWAKESRPHSGGIK